MLARRSIRILFLSALAVILLHPLGIAAAENEKVGGYVSGTQKVLSSFDLADGNIAKRIEFSATVVTDDPTNPIHLASQDCFVTYIFTKENKPVGGKGSCDGISVDGHVWWLALELRADGIVRWTNLGGVGKFAKLTGSGTTSVSAEFTDGKFIGRFEGTYSDQ